MPQWYTFFSPDQSIPSRSMFGGEGGISWKGKTSIMVFSGIMNAEGYVQLLRESLLPFIRNMYPDGHRLMQDNDPKHTSRKAQVFF